MILWEQCRLLSVRISFKTCQENKVCFLIFPYSEAKCLRTSLCLELLGKFSSKSLTLTDVLTFMAKIVLTIPVKSFISDRKIKHLTSKIGETLSPFQHPKSVNLSPPSNYIVYIKWPAHSGFAAIPAHIGLGGSLNGVGQGKTTKNYF